MLAVIRPYGDYIREHIFAILAEGGLDTADTVVVDAQESDAAVVRMLGNYAYDSLLVPYHVERLPDGGKQSGLSALQALLAAKQLPPYAPIFMAISVFGRVAFQAEHANLPEATRDRLDRQLLALHGPFDDHQPHIRAVRDFLQTFREHAG